MVPKMNGNGRQSSSQTQKERGFICESQTNSNQSPVNTNVERSLVVRGAIQNLVKENLREISPKRSGNREGLKTSLSE